MQLCRVFFYLIWFVIGVNYTIAQSVLKGKITDEKGNPLSFVSVFVKGTQIGTTCNEAGNYELRLSAGTYEIRFHYIGYAVQNKFIELSDKETKQLDIVMLPSTYQLKEVNIKATAEDPAYPIMRQVIARRGIYRQEAKEYQCRVYMKGMQRLTTIPKRVLLIKVPEDIKPGIVYLSESLSDLSFQRPNKIKERLISSKVSGDNQAFSYNQASALQFTLYDNIVPSYGLNQRGFISPLASNAMMYYRFRLIGESKENNLTVFKIQIIPIRKNDPVFKGHIYIVKDSWRLHSTDLVLDKESNIEFVDTLYIKQNYAQQPGGVWMPVSQRLIFQLGILGFRGNGYFVSVYSNYKVKSLYPATFYTKEDVAIVENRATPEVRKVEKIKAEQIIPKQKGNKAQTKSTETDSSLFVANYFTKEVLSVDVKSNKTDDSTWNAIRPVPLTEEEVSDYHEKDSVQQVVESKEYMDSMDRKGNKLDWSSFTLSGYSYARSYERQYFYVDPILTVIQFNTVEGWVVNPMISFTKTFKDEKKYSIVPHLRYGFASKQFYAQANLRYYFDPVKDFAVALGGGFFVEQFNRTEPITPAINTFYSLILEENYLKLYQKGFIKPAFSGEVVNGLVLVTSLEYSQRVSLSNNTNYTFKDKEGKEYSSNQPANIEMPNTYFTPHHALTFDINLRITFDQKYASRPYEKINYGSKYPRLHLSYRKGLPWLNSKVNFDEFNIWVNDGMDFKLFGHFSYHLKAGTFLNNQSVFFPDFHHFNGNQTIVAMPLYRGFQLLDYYAYSTSKSFFESHLSHHFNGFWFNKIPWFRKLKWQEVVSLNYLKTPTSPSYLELGVGIEHIFKMFRVDYFQSYLNTGYSMQGFVIGFGF